MSTVDPDVDLLFPPDTGNGLIGRIVGDNDGETAFETEEVVLL